MLFSSSAWSIINHCGHIDNPHGTNAWCISMLLIGSPQTLPGRTGCTWSKMQNLLAGQVPSPVVSLYNPKELRICLAEKPPSFLDTLQGHLKRPFWRCHKLLRSAQQLLRAGHLAQGHPQCASNSSWSNYLKFQICVQIQKVFCSSHLCYQSTIYFQVESKYCWFVYLFQIGEIRF